MATMTLDQVTYGPNPLYVRQGQQMYYEFDVVFDDVPPDAIEWMVELKDSNDVTYRTLSGTKATNGQQTVHVAIRTTPTTDLGSPLPFRNLKNIFSVTAVASESEGFSLESTEYPPINQRVCSGIDPVPEPQDCECGDACPTGR